MAMIKTYVKPTAKRPAFSGKTQLAERKLKKRARKRQSTKRLNIHQTTLVRSSSPNLLNVMLSATPNSREQNEMTTLPMYIPSVIFSLNTMNKLMMACGQDSKNISKNLNLKQIEKDESKFFM